MTIRTAHGRNAAVGLVVETLPPDEQPQPQPINHELMPAPIVRREDGTIADSTSAKVVGRAGGLAKAAKRAALQSVGLHKVAPDDDIHPYWAASKKWVDAVNQEYAVSCGGVMGPAAMSIVGSAGALLLASRFFSDLALKAKNNSERAGHFITASKFHDRHRQALLTAYELANRLGAARGQATTDPFVALAKIAERESALLDPMPVIDVLAE